MTCCDSLEVSHEPFGDVWYFGREKLCSRYSDEERQKSGYADTTYEDVIDELAQLGKSTVSFLLVFWGFLQLLDCFWGGVLEGGLLIAWFMHVDKLWKSVFG